MKKILLTLGVIGALSGCAQISELTGATINPQSAAIAANSFDVLEATATAYLQLVPCGHGQKVCRDATAVSKIIPAVQSGRIARNQIEALLTANNGAAIPVANFNTLQAAINTLQGVYSSYNIQTK